jgi:Asp/Glu/hydantoin racemase
MSAVKLNATGLFSMYMQVAGVPTLVPEPDADPALRGKKLGLVNGSAWIMLWSYYFGRLLLPGVKLINVGNDAVQLNFMAAHSEGELGPPTANIDAFVSYAEDLVSLQCVDTILLTCSTMNRSVGVVRDAMERHDVPVVQIDEPLMEDAVRQGGNILVIATHGPTVTSTHALLSETADRLGKEVSFSGATVEEAFALLGQGDIEAHNEVIARAIRRNCSQQKVDVIVLAQLSMSVFKLSYPDCVGEFGMPVLTSAESGFARVKAVLLGRG